MKILLLCDRPNPPAYIPRVRYWCNYLAECGHEVTLVTEKSDIQHFVSDKVKVITFNYYRFEKTTFAKLEWFWKTFINLIYDHKGRWLFGKAMRAVGFEEFDVLLCSSTFHSFPITTAARITAQKHIPFVADLRDIVEQTPMDSNNIFVHRLPMSLGRWITRFYKKLHIGRRNRSITEAKAIVSVSEWHSEFLKKYNPNSYVIYNGFDEQVFATKTTSQERFNIAYFGELNDINLRYPLVLFSALRDIISRGKVDSGQLTMRWFTDKQSWKLVEDFSQKFGLEHIMEHCQFVANSEFAEAMAESSIVVIFSHNPKLKGYNGIMTTKFFEYLGAARPILITPDNHDELSATAKNIRCGLVSSDSEEIEHFILDKYAEWQATQTTKSGLTEYDRAKFARLDGAKLLVGLFSL